MDDGGERLEFPCAASLTPKQLFEQLYSDLHRKAKAIIRSKHRMDPTSPSSLVHEAYLRLRRSEPLDLNDESHFIALASATMRRIVIDRARSLRSNRRGGGLPQTTTTDIDVAIDRDPNELIAIDEALERISSKQPRASQVGELLIFASLGVSETATLLGVSRKTIQRDINVLASELNQLGYGRSESTVSG